ncbi:MAG: hypothetical protein KA801_06410 [Syntrophorhabdaceae bacterium]|nr:hypothetical protein [Syntrophorhabdaceae bacterium]
MAQCPQCKAEYRDRDRFCMFCGKPLADAPKDGRIYLTQNDLAALAGSADYSSLSPLAPYHAGAVTSCPVTLDAAVSRAILSPKRAFYFIELTRDAFLQDVLLVSDGSCYRWSERDSAVTISREKSPRDFIGWTKQRLTASVTSEKELPLLSIRKESLKTLAAIAVLCRELSRVDKAASFITLSHLKSFLDGKEVSSEEIDYLAGNGFIRIMDDADPLIFLEEKGEELYLLLNEYDRYFIIQVLTGGEPDYPSFGLAARQGSACLITNPGGDADLVIRRADPEAIGSLINWAWTVHPLIETPVPAAPPREVRNVSMSPSATTQNRQQPPIREKTPQRNPVSDPSPGSSRKVLILVIAAVAFVLVIITVAGGYWYWKSQTAAPGTTADTATEKAPVRKAIPETPTAVPAAPTPGATPPAVKPPKKAATAERGTVVKPPPQKQQPPQGRAGQQQTPQKSSGSWLDKTLGTAPGGPVTPPSTDPRDMGR